MPSRLSGGGGGLLFRGLVVASLVASSAVGARSGDDSLDAGFAAIRPEGLKAHVVFLSDDLLEGRGTATRGHEIAARYVATQLAGMGVAPAGDGGSYLQRVPLRVARLSAARTSLSIILRRGRRKLEPGRDFVASPSLLEERAEVEAPAVYVGYGVEAPQAGHDDYAGVDVRGKVVVCLLGAPASLAPDERAYYASRRVKNDTAAAHGAVALLAIIPPEAEKRVSFERLAGNSGRDSMTWLDEGRPGDEEPGIRARAVLSRTAAGVLLSEGPRSLDALFEEAARGEVDSFEVPAKIRLHVESRLAETESPNVVGVLRGSDPELSKEYVVVSAHLDHLGIGRSRDGDSIYNGAYDNASGVAALLEVARGLAALPRPRRSVLFLADTGEEKGLLGAEYFASRPTVPAGSIVADLNVDMFLALYPVRDVVAHGEAHSTLGEVVRAEAARLGLEVSRDPFPEESLFVRSDHYAFIRKGIPSISLESGLESADARIDGGNILREWMARVYHSPKDDATQPMDFDSSARIARLYLAMVRHVAQDERRPSWSEGDFFAARFVR